MQSYDPQLTAPSLPYRLFNMEVALALVILLLLLIIIGFWVILPVGPLKEFLTTIINDVHSTYKLGIASKQQSSTHDKVATRPLYHHPLKHQYKGEHNDDTGTDDTDTETITNSTVTTNDINLKETPDNKSSFESSSLEMMNNDKNARKISMRKNETKNCDKSPLATSSLQWPSTLSSLSSPPLSPPPSPLPNLPSPPTSTAKETTITSSDENTEIRSKPKSKKKRRKRNSSTSQLQSLPTKQRQKKPSVDTCISYSSLPDDIKKKHPDHQKYTSDNPESTGLPDATVKTVPREARGAISLPQPPLSCSLPPVITVPPSGNQSTHSMVSLPPLPIPHHGNMSLESSNSVPPPVLPSVPPVVVRDESVNGANNEEGGIVSQLDLVKFENENTRAFENERNIDDDDDDDAAVGARVPSSQLPELVTEHVPVQSSTDAPPLLDYPWEAQQPVDVNMEPPTDEIVITPLVLHFPQELQDQAELVLPDLELFKEPESFIDSGDDIN